MDGYDDFGLLGEGEEVEFDGLLHNMDDILEMPSTSFPIKGRTYITTSLFAEAVKAVMRGKMNVNKAASVYRVPRSSLQRKVARSRMEHKRKDNPVIVEKIEAKAKKESDDNEEEKRRLWSEEYQRRLDEAEANVISDEMENIPSNDILGMAVHSLYDHDYVEMANECIIEENVDPLIDQHIYLQDQIEEEEDDIPPPPQIVIESGKVEDCGEEEVIVDELEELDENTSGMPQLDAIYDY
ncbi:hypothetical protein PRIPAC_74281 [Pristionchus pacificus]|uniref:HTH psq-type domain-containing protein n=1 Tax=Pristionchus pacificus TaxID=54126 RepID=A0A2A6CRR5_PRIPA|nr:hypothetical protein PRIPAC_74281 [Pristionchus pacificus]|eukprot:PDM80895.1 hypothetical protein PRIPAC_35898 [Pristionchus pacificus]